MNGTTSFAGVDWTPENGNPEITCPYCRPEPCELNHELLRDHPMSSRATEKLYMCACRSTNEPYSYERSIEKASREVWDESERLFANFFDLHHGRVCKNCCWYCRTTKEWYIQYDPVGCARTCYSQDGRCPILQTEILPQKGNVYYDRIVTRTEKGEGLFPDKVITTATKGIKLLDHPASLTICEAIIKYAKWRIIKEKTESFNFKQRWDFRNDQNFSIQLLNFRAESRDVRDLRQDLADIQEGIEVIHASDQQKAAKAKKHERRNKALDDKKCRLEKRILEIGFDGLDDLEMHHYKKWFTNEDEEKILQRLEVKKELLKDATAGEQMTF
ncbi:hypothetical protein [Caproicibacter fermentans]|uniref:Sarcolemmal membrane-associated protein n=1 Tax=Caproicibacter fermentans TaxID=2576756 RepID=A0A7G8TE09_9FIRM|nr:hypothetical protein [Caproicibacter fermentans]QNK41850.1 hypothetical protein HCR03_06305 [Caproicibacter fermentans]